MQEGEEGSVCRRGMSEHNYLCVYVHEKKKPQVLITHHLCIVFSAGRVLTKCNWGG